MLCKSAEHARHRARQRARVSGNAWRYLTDTAGNWRAERATTGDDPPGTSGVWRFAIVRPWKAGGRGWVELAQAAQGCYTYATWKAAEAQLAAIRQTPGNDPATVAEFYPEGTHVALVECWPGHHDPKGVYMRNPHRD